jgi:murein DD-endopeptidase MepM/ murein hydrolase activator NlpD
MTLVLVAFPAAAHAWVLQRGDRGEDVRVVQRTLSSLGFRTAADGMFGPGTQRSVKRYERREDLVADGRVSRGQLRGMFRRLGEAMPVDLDNDERWQPASAPRRHAGDDAAEQGGFPIQGEWEWGESGAHFGDRGGAHKGEDLFADCGTPLIAAEGGKVVFTGSDGSAGNYLVIRGAQTGEDHVYMHMQSPPTSRKGDSVETGASIGAVGQTGNASACHLHFEIWTAPGWYEGGAARDPRPDLKSWAGGS